MHNFPTPRVSGLEPTTEKPLVRAESRLLLPMASSPKTPGAQLDKSRAYRSSSIHGLLSGKTQLDRLDHLALFVLTAAAALLRTYKLTEPPKVVFDEVNVGGYVKEYYDGRFFVDVHPPLVKLIYYYIALALGWNGEFNFTEIGSVYDISTPYVAMRLFSAFSGALTVPATFLALKASFCRTATAAFGASLVLFENSSATQSRFILLDSPLVFFTALTVYAFQQFQTAVPFTRKWLSLLLCTGVFLGLAISTKLTGYFTLAWVCAWSVFHMWTIVGDLSVSLKAVFLHAAARTFGFFVAPLMIYLQIFVLHFNLLPYNGTGSGAVTPAFKSGFADSAYLNGLAADVSYGSVVTIRHRRLHTYLHSHNFTYQLGSNEQQVTMYGFSGDGQNEWVIEPIGTNFDGKFDKFRPIHDRDAVKLYHKATGKYLSATDVRPPNSEHEYSNEVSCKGNQTDLAHQDYEWTVQIVDTMPGANASARTQVKATQSVFKLEHKETRCMLMGQNVFLPEWAFHQNQVLCMIDPTETNILWYIEMNHHPQIDDDLEKYPRVQLPKLLLWQKLVEYHQAMWRTNNSFVKKHPYDSLPYTWLVPVRGIAFFSNGHGSEKMTDEPVSHIYMLGNFAVYATGFVVVVIFGLKFFFYLLKHLNPFETSVEKVQVTIFYTKTLQYISGWFLNFYPFVYQERKLFAHHYLTSVFFLVLATAQFSEYQMFQLSRKGWFFMFIVSASTLYFFWALFPLITGSSWTVKQCQNAKRLPTWDFDCMAYSE